MVVFTVDIIRKGMLRQLLGKSFPELTSAKIITSVTRFLIQHCSSMCLIRKRSKDKALLTNMPLELTLVLATVCRAGARESVLYQPFLHPW